MAPIHEMEEEMSHEEHQVEEPTTEHNGEV